MQRRVRRRIHSRSWHRRDVFWVLGLRKRRGLLGRSAPSSKSARVERPASAADLPGADVRSARRRLAASLRWFRLTIWIRRGGFPVVVGGFGRVRVPWAPGRFGAGGDFSGMSADRSSLPRFAAAGGADRSAAPAPVCARRRTRVGACVKDRDFGGNHGAQRVARAGSTIVPRWASSARHAVCDMAPLAVAEANGAGGIATTGCGRAGWVLP